MGLNVLALLRHLSTSPTSPLPHLAESGYTKPSTVFFSYLGWFFVYSFERARWVYGALAMGAVGFVLLLDTDGEERKKSVKSVIGNGNGSAIIANGDANKKTKLAVNGFAKPKSKPFANGAPTTHTPSSSSTPNTSIRNNPTITALLALGSSILGTLLLPNLVAIVLDKVLGRGMSWFANEYSVILLFAPPALLGSFLFFFFDYCVASF